jgi:hypothetical protein
VPAAATALPSLPVPVQSLPPAPGASIPPEALVGGAVLVLVLGYVAFYWRGLSAGDRYADGFVVERCPVCKEGHLEVETRQVRVLGVPRPRTTVRCDNCRSVLREVRAGRWRYAVDRAANPALYNQLNGRVVSADTLRMLEQQAPPAPPTVRPPAAAPTFTDDEE